MPSPSTDDPSASSPLLVQLSPTPTNTTFLTQTSHHHHHPIVRFYRFIYGRTRWYLSSAAQHYTILLLVSLDLLTIFADITINLHQCDFPGSSRKWENARSGLGIAGLVFSCLFMVELCLNLWVFGWRYLTTPFHLLDTLVILASFTIDILLHGTLEEIGSLIIILRLWRVFKIIEEFSIATAEEHSTLTTRIQELTLENGDLRAEIRRFSKGSSGSEISMSMSRRTDSEV